MKIKVCDMIMGAGKTEAAINQMLQDKENNYIFITPYLNEIERIKKSCKKRKFLSPENIGKGKLDSLHHLIDNKCNIATTHALFKQFSKETIKLIKENNYKLILDETFDIIEKISISNSDINNMLKNYIKLDNDGEKVIWIDKEYTGTFEHLKEMAEDETLFLHNNKLMLYMFPIEIFKSFKEIIILTYMFDAQIQKYYFDLNNIKTEHIGVKKIKDKYYFIDNINQPEYVKDLKDKIHILDDDKINKIGEGIYDLSSTWFKNANKSLISKLKNNLNNVYKNKFKSQSKFNMWTTFKNYRSKLSGKGYIRGFVSCNAKSTNKFMNKTHLAYCLNVFLDPFVKNYFLSKKIKVREDDYALSEMVQWIWRSAIRSGEDIWIYIPSKRMRELLKDWLESFCNTS